jgi:alpha-L-rhamnosidase
VTPELVVEHGNRFVGTASPRLTWRLPDDVPGWEQAEAEVALGEAVVRVVDAESVLVPWPFEPLVSRQQVAVRVRLTAKDGRQTAWSNDVEVEAALLEPTDWSARMITPDLPDDPEGLLPPPLLRRELDVRPDLVSARLYITAHGLYSAHVSGARVSDHLFAPGWSAYRKRLRYQVHDVTALLQPGRQALGIALADGWYRGYLVPTVTRRNWYGDRVGAMAQLEMVHADGSREVVVTDESWQAGTGPRRSADIYRGESYDARLEAPGWSAPGFDTAGWAGCVTVDRDPASLVCQYSPPVRMTERVRPVSLGTSSSGKTIVDFGQNLVGHVRLDVEAAPGTEVVLRHAEILQDGELCTEPLRAATATDTYVAAGLRSWAPEFTFHGFRYAEVTGTPVTSDAISAEVVHSDMRRTGWFSCSDPLVTRLHENAVWSMRGNFLDVPTDCPQRDERLGWTGDLQVFAPSASFLYDSHALLDSWLADLTCEQAEDGGVPHVVPNPIPYLYSGGTAAAWSDAAVIVPWVLYQRRGDLALLARQWPSMVAFTDCLLREQGPELNPELHQYGDWVDPRAPLDKPGDGPTDKQLVVLAYLVYALDIMTASATLVDAPDADRFRDAADRYRSLWRSRYLLADGSLSNDTEAAHALAICFRLLTSEEGVVAGARLAALLEAGGFRIATGFVGTPLVCDALVSTGQVDAAYQLLLQVEPPSWLYPVTQGATTIWERWDSLMPDGRVNPSEMTSFNHYALGAVVDWLHRTVGGLAPLSPGYRDVLVRPVPGGGLTWAKTKHTSPYGDISVSWSTDGEAFSCEVVVPAGARALLVLPLADWKPVTVGSGTHGFTGVLELPGAGALADPSGAPWETGRP